MKTTPLMMCLGLFSALALGQSAAGQDLLKVGFAERDITPEIGMEQPGGYGKAYHRSVHDPCKVRASVFDDGERRVALVGVDALMVPRHLVVAARKEIASRTGIAAGSVLIGASHSHSSGPTGMVQPGEFDHASDLVKTLAYEKSSCADPRYLEQVETAIVEAVVSADQDRVSARCSVGVGVEDQVAFNRRFRMKNGLVYTHPQRGNTDIVEVAGPTDPQVGVIGAWGEGDRLLGCVVNFCCHATTNPGGVSANWIYYLEKVIRGAFGEDVVVVFLQGFSGDVTQVDNLSPSAERGAEDSARFVGGRVGAEAVKVLLTAPRGALGPVDCRARTVEMPRRVPSAARLAACLDTVKREPADVGHTEWTFGKEIVLLDALESKEPKREVEVQAIQVGPAVFLSNPGEVFCRLGLELRSRSPFSITFPVELANGCVGYIPTEDALSEHGGGYETRLTSYSNLVPEAGSRLNDLALELAGELTPGTAPSYPPAPAFRAPWSYGNVPAERE